MRNFVCSRSGNKRTSFRSGFVKTKEETGDALYLTDFEKMGRVKLKIKRLDNNSNRQVTYSKRKSGILKKADELSILCDIDIVLLMFSPTGKPTIYHGQRSNFEQVIAQFAQLPPQERAKRKLESLEVLKKTFKKLDHDVNIEDFLGSSKQTVEELSNGVRVLQSQLSETHNRLSYWNNPEKIENVEHLRQMEDSLKESLNQIHLRKENLEKHRLMSLECSSEVVNCLSDFQNGMHLPLVMGGMQDGQQLPWFPSNENQQVMWPDETSLFQHRDVKCNIIENSVPGNSGFYGSGGSKQFEMDNSRQVEVMTQDCYNLNDMTATCLGIQMGEQYPYNNPYGNASLQEDVKMIAEPTGINFQENPIHYDHVANNNNFELPGSMYNNGILGWLPPPGSCNIPVYNENSYPQQPN